MRNWPRLTVAQRELMQRISKTKHGDFYVSGGRMWQTVHALVYKGMVVGSGTAWYSLTPRGRDYLRFGKREATMSAKRAKFRVGQLVAGTPGRFFAMDVEKFYKVAAIRESTDGKFWYDFVGGSSGAEGALRRVKPEEIRGPRREKGDAR